MREVGEARRSVEVLESGPALVDGPVGAIEVVFDIPKSAARGVAIVAHPQPLLGGHAMHKVPHVLARGLCEVGWLLEVKSHDRP